MVIKVTVMILPSTEVYMFYDNQSLVLTSGNLHHRPSILLLLPRTILQWMVNNLNPQRIKNNVCYILRKTVGTWKWPYSKEYKGTKKAAFKLNLQPECLEIFQCWMRNQYKHDKLLIISKFLIFIFLFKFVVLTIFFLTYNLC